MKTLMIVIAVMFLGSCGIGTMVTAVQMASKGKESPTKPPRATPPPKPTPKASEALQAEREKLIRDLIKMGVVTKIDVPGSLPRVYCTFKWRMLDIDQKKTLANMMIAWSFKIPKDGNLEYMQIMTFHDSSTGKQFATMSSNGYRED